MDLLNEMRRGEISPAAKQTFLGLSRPLPQDDGLLPTELFPLRAEVDRANAARMASLAGPSFKYEARDTGAAPPEKRAKLLDAMVAPRMLELKEDAQVMLIKNVDESLVNGSVGKILGFYTPAVCLASLTPAISVTPQTKKEGASSTAKPKSSSQDSSKTNGFVRNVQVGPDGRTPLALCPGENKENKVPSSKGKGKAKEDELHPLVEFRTPQGKEVVLIARDEFRSEDNEGKLLARRVQVSPVYSPEKLCAHYDTADPFGLGLGDVDSQESGPNNPACQGRPRSGIRERYGAFPSQGLILTDEHLFSLKARVT